MAVTLPVCSVLPQTEPGAQAGLLGWVFHMHSLGPAFLGKCLIEGVVWRQVRATGQGRG